MSPNQITTDELTDNGHHLVPFPYVVRVYSETGKHVGSDAYRTREGRDYAARMLAQGACQLQPHRPLGTRVQPATAASAAQRPAMSQRHMQICHWDGGPCEHGAFVARGSRA